MDKSNIHPGNIDDFISPVQWQQFLDYCKHLSLDGETQLSIEEMRKRFYRSKGEDFVIAQEVREFINQTEGGWFSTGQIYTRLHLSTRQDKKNVVTELIREKEKGTIESHPRKDGYYRKIICESEYLDWQSASTKEIAFLWPLEMEKLGMDFLPGDLIVVAGDQNAGKTTWILDFIRLNMTTKVINYYTSEMNASRLKRRLAEFKHVDEWIFTPYHRASNWADAVRKYPDDINIFDFLEVHDDFYREVGRTLFEIHKATIGGISIVAIQKDADKPLGRGKGFGMEKAVLYLTIDHGKMKIMKAKSWKEGFRNPNYRCHDFKIINGAEFLSVSSWYKEEYRSKQF